MEFYSDYLIIGAGPAGIQLAYFLQKAGRDYQVLEAGDGPGTFFKTYPRHRRLISINKVYTGYKDKELNMRWDWNSLVSDSEEMLFKHYSKEYFPPADVLPRYLSDFEQFFQLKVKHNVEVTKITKDDHFRVVDSQGNVYSCARLIVATGVRKQNIPPIPGIEWAEQYANISVDPEDFIGQRVLIIGKGNSGFEVADCLTGTAASIHMASPGCLKLAWKSHYLGHLRAVNNNFLDTYLLKSGNGMMDGTIDSIERRDGEFVVKFSFTRAHGAQAEYTYDRIILCAGFRFDASIFDESCMPALAINDRFPAQTSEWESTNIKDLYFAGTLMQTRDFKKTQSTFIHGFRYNVGALNRMFGMKYHGEEWPNQVVPLTTEALTRAILDRLNCSPALFQQPGFLCDLMVISEQDGSARYYQELPVDYVRDSSFGQHDNYYMITLEYGPDYSNYPFEFDRYISAEEAHLNPQLHPIIRRFARSTPVAEHHILEDLNGQWLTDQYILPLRAFIQRQLSDSQAVDTMQLGTLP